MSHIGSLTGMSGIVSQYLKTNGEGWNSKLFSTGAYYSDPILQQYSEGFASLLVLLSAGSLDITT